MGHESTIPPMPEITVPALLPEHALFLRDDRVPSLKIEHAVTRRVIEAIPRRQRRLPPGRVAKSAVDLAWHIAGAEHRFMDAVVTGAFDFTDAAAGRPDDSADVARWYAETSRRTSIGSRRCRRIS